MNYFKYPHEKDTNKRNNNFIAYDERSQASSTTFTKHVHNYCEVILFLGGRATYGTDTFSMPLEPYNLIITPKLTYHYIYIPKKETYKRIIVKLKDTTLDEIIHNSNITGGVFDISNIPTLKNIFNAIQSYSDIYDENNLSNFELLVNGTAQALCSLMQYPSLKDNLLAANSNYPPVLNSIITYINTHLATVTVNDLSVTFNLSTSYIWTLFKKYLICSPKNYIVIKKLTLAKSLIDKGVSKTEAASLCGYENYPSFYRAYTKLYPPPEKR